MVREPEDSGRNFTYRTEVIAFMGCRRGEKPLVCFGAKTFVMTALA